MAKKFENIEREIKSKEKEFYKFLENALEGELFEFLRELSKNTNVYIFSGIIRNYFLHNYLIRDVDVIVDSDEVIKQILSKTERNFEINSFGGYKIKLGNKNLDLWKLDNTWGLKKVPKIFDIDLETYIPTTAFFNFSAIVYSLNSKKFIYTEDFLRFLYFKTLNYVYPPNLNRQLCIVNTFYYSDKYKLKVGDELFNLIQRWHKSGIKDYHQVQLTHFGEEIYSSEEIDSRLVQKHYYVK